MPHIHFEVYPSLAKATSSGHKDVFTDGTSLQLASVTGSAEAGHVATLTVGIPA